MSAQSLRVVVVDDERPARAFLTSLLRNLPGVAIVGEAADGAEAVRLIEKCQPDVAFLDLQMPEVDGLTAVRLIKRRLLPLIVFVTAHDAFAVKAFELNAVDYLLKPATAARVRDAVQRVRERLERHETRATSAVRRDAARVEAAARTYGQLAIGERIDRIPVRHRDEILLVPVAQVASVVADGELLRLSALRGETYTLNYRLKDLEARLDPTRFVRLARGTLVNIDAITKVGIMPGGLYTVRLSNGQDFDVSRIQSRSLRDRLLRL